ncbi:MAG: Holliday junction branch migration protein RuvA [Clostridia bacterium]|nr:Holliday junction branch migration protein RuvA [Clostridia bacterium]
MYSYIKGNITERTEGQIVLECNNIGYEISVSSYCQRALETVSGEVKIYTYYQQKEDGVALFGFCDQEEKNIFLKLIGVSGVGPKGAIAILSNIKPDELSKVIAKQDVKTLSSVKGVGKKTAERLVVELKDKIDVLPLEVIDDIKLSSGEIDDACEVLISLGLSKNEAMKLAQGCYQKGDSAEDIISKSLAQMRK